jgi:glycerophosphoryl diester phosphodiesterase
MLPLFIILVILLGVRYRFFWRARLRPNPPKVMAHRGLKTHSPENTISSYKEAVDHGFDAIEIDLIQTKDGILMCSHNFDLERETSGQGWIHQKNEKELNSIKTGVYSHGNNTQSMPTFFEVLSTIPEKTFLNIEIKTRKLFDMSAAKSLGKTIRNKTINHPFMISSFNPIVVAYFRIFHSNVSVGFILQDIEWLWVTHWIHPDFFHPRGDLVDDEIIEMSQNHKLPLILWTINTQPAMTWCKKNNIKSIITDNPMGIHV